MILLIDFGSQTAHLIARRIREMGTEVMVAVPSVTIERIKELKPEGIIFSGGPASVYDKGAPTIDKKIFKLGIPILGICYGQQLICFLLGGRVKAGYKKEFGPAEVNLFEKSFKSKLLDRIPDGFIAWMSHGDQVIKIPEGFKTYGRTATISHAVIANEKHRIYGIQFHPEVVHTEFGGDLLRNFLSICNASFKSANINKDFVIKIISNIKDSMQNEKAICALSGGVDSSVAAVLVNEAIGKNLQCIYIDSGLMRERETEILEKVFKKHYKMKIKIVNARTNFLKNLQGITDPEEKRKVVGKTFIDVFEKEAKKTDAKFLVQGTIYPDVIESAGTKHSKKIKSHHNVGGLPEDMQLRLLEPLRDYYKDEVRIIGKILGLPPEITERQPFPGPGLAVRIIGDVTEEKLKILRKADKIVQDEIRKSQHGENLWQVFAVFTGIKTTGVRGDNRAYGETIAIRAIEAKDAMSANFAKLPYDLLEKISTRIVNEIKEVNRVVYDITNKPPATMEWE